LSLLEIEFRWYYFVAALVLGALGLFRVVSQALERQRMDIGGIFVTILGTWLAIYSVVSSLVFTTILGIPFGTALGLLNFVGAKQGAALRDATLPSKRQLSDNKPPGRAD
jgi:hypothetical protein